MAVNAGEIEATLRLRDEMTAELKKANAALGNLESVAGFASQAMTALGISFGISTIVDFGRDLINASDNIVKTSERTGLLIDEVQRLEFIAGQSGNTLGELTAAVGRLQDNLGSGNTAAVGAVKALGVNLDELKAATPFEQMKLLADAIGKIEDPVRRAAIATDLFGRGGITILPTLTSNFKELGDAAPVMAESTVRAMDSAGDAIDRLKLQFRAAIAQGLEPFVKRTEDAFSASERQRLESWFNTVGLSVRGLASDLKDLKRGFDVIRGVDLGTPKLPSAPPGTRVRRLPEIDGTVRTLEEMRDVEKELTEIYKKQHKELEKIANLRSQLFGQADIAKARDLMKALGPLSNLTRVNAEDQKRLNEAVSDAIDAFTREGRVAPEAMRALFVATRQVPPVITGLSSAFRELGIQIKSGSGELFTFAGLAPKVLHKLDADFTDFGSTGEGALRRIKEETAAASQALVELDKEMRESLIPSLRQIAGLAGDSLFGNIVGMVSDVIPSLQQAEKAMKALRDGGLSGAAALGSAVSAVAGYATTVLAVQQTVVSILETIDAHAGLETRQFLRASGALRDLNLEMRVAGINAEKLFAIKDADEFNAAFAAATREIEQTNAAMQAFGLTWRDFTDVTQEFVTQAGRDLIDHWDRFIAVGVDADKLLGGMSVSFNQLIRDAVQTGSKIPSALRPMLEQLIRTKKITEETAAALLGMTKDAGPSFEELSTLAQRYGIELDRLGPKVNQLRIADIGKRLAEDFRVFMDAGADMNTVLEGMKDEVQELVTAALDMGLELPASLKPLVEALIAAGLLTDQFGNKLTDVGQLTFAESLVDKVDELIDAIRDLIDETDRYGDEAVKQFGRARNAAEILGRAIPRGFVPGGGGGGNTEPGTDTAVPRGGEAGVRGGGTVILEIGGRTLAEIVVPELPDAVQRYGLA